MRIDTGLPSRVACRWRLAPADRRRIETGRAPPDAGVVSGRSRQLRLLKTWSLRQTRSGSAAAVALAANLLFSSQGGYFDGGAALKLLRSAVRWLKSEHREVEYRGVSVKGWHSTYGGGLLSLSGTHDQPLVKVGLSLHSNSARLSSLKAVSTAAVK